MKNEKLCKEENFNEDFKYMKRMSNFSIGRLTNAKWLNNEGFKFYLAWMTIDKRQIESVTQLNEIVGTNKQNFSTMTMNQKEKVKLYNNNVMVFLHLLQVNVHPRGERLLLHARARRVRILRHQSRESASMTLCATPCDDAVAFMGGSPHTLVSAN